MPNFVISKDRMVMKVSSEGIQSLMLALKHKTEQQGQAVILDSPKILTLL